jgi:hypothetical protein
MLKMLLKRLTGLTPRLTLMSAATYMGAYSAAAITAYMSQVHKEFCPIYTAITLAAVLHLLVELKRKDDPPRPDDKERLLMP